MIKSAFALSEKVNRPNDAMANNVINVVIFFMILMLIIVNKVLHTGSQPTNLPRLKFLKYKPNP